MLHVANHTTTSQQEPHLEGSVLVEDGPCMVLIGGSIADCGRGPDHLPYGRCYVGLVRAIAGARQPG